MINKFWLGQTPMWINVWILGIVFFRLLFIGALLGIDYLESEYDVSISLNTIMFILLPIYFFWGIGTWRSAQIYRGIKKTYFQRLASSLTELFVIIKCGSHILALFMGSSMIF